MIKLKFLLLILLITSVNSMIFSQENTANNDLLEKRRSIVKYGTESQIETLCKALAKEKVTDLNQDLISIFDSTPSVVIKQSILNMFAQLEDKSLIEQSKNILNNYNQHENPLNLEAIKYLGVIKEATASTVLITIINESYNDTLMLEAAQSLGKCSQSKETAEFLIARTTSSITNANYMAAESYITAMANTQNEVINETMISILENLDNPNSVRGKVVREMGNYINPAFPPKLAAAFQTKDLFIKTSVLTSLAKYPTAPETRVTLETALRDDAWRLRSIAMKSFAEMKDSSIVEHIIYIAKNDKEETVRIEAYEALGKIASSEATGFLKDSFRDSKRSNAQRLVAYKAMQDMGSAILEEDAIDLIKKQKDTKKMPGFEKNLCKVIDKAETSQEKFYELFLQCADKDIVNMGLNGVKKFNVSSLKAAVESAGEKNHDFSKKAKGIAENL